MNTPPRSLTAFRVEPATLRLLLVVALPMIISQGAYAVMTFTDRYFMSLVSPLSMSASMGGGLAGFLCLSLFIGVLSYGNALVARAFGAGQIVQCPQVAFHGFLLMLGSLPLLAILAFWVGKLFLVMGHPPAQRFLEEQYFYTVIWCAPFVLLNVCVGAYFCGIGQMRKVMIADLLGMLINIPLSYCLIFGEYGMPSLGIVGAALGTVIGTACTGLVFVAFYFEARHRRAFAVMQSFVFDRQIFSRYLSLGIPSGLEIFLNIAAFNLFLLLFQSYGVTEGAAATIVFNWHILALVPMLGLNIAMISLVGRALGADDRRQTQAVIRAGFAVGLSYACLLLVLFLCFRNALVDVFMAAALANTAISELAADLMIGLAAYVLADAVIIVAGGTLRGAGDTRWIMLCSVSLYWVMLMLQFLIIKVWVLDPRISFALFVLLIISIAMAFLWRLKSGRWYRPVAATAASYSQ